MAVPFALVGKRLLGMGSVPAPPHVFALDAATLRYGRFVQAGGGWELREMRRVELPAETFQPGLLGGPLREPPAFAQRLAQRLVRVLCPRCRRETALPPTTLRESGLDPDLYEDQRFFEPGGCDECLGSGFLGRTAVAELLDMSDRIRQMILERRPATEIKQAAREEGMTFLRDSALEKVFAGITTLREINKVTFVQ